MAQYYVNRFSETPVSFQADKYVIGEHGDIAFLNAEGDTVWYFVRGTYSSFQVEQELTD